MKRAISLLFSLPLIASAGGLMPMNYAAFMMLNSSSLTCQSYALQSLNDTYHPFSQGPLCQKIKITGTQTICEVSAWINNVPTGDTIHITFTLRTAINGGGSILATTQTGTSSGVGIQKITMTFASNPVVSADCYLTWETTDGSTGDRWVLQDTDPYEGTPYSAYYTTNNDNNEDYAFEIKTKQ